VKKGADVKAKNTSGLTPLHYLCQRYKNDNLIDIVQLLIENGAEVNAKDNYGWTPLSLLCRFNEHAIKGGDNWKSLVRLFEKNGVSMDVRDYISGMTINHILINRKKRAKSEALMRDLIL